MQWWQQQGPCLRQSSILPNNTGGEIRPRFWLVLVRRGHAASATLLSGSFQHDALGRSKASSQEGLQNTS